MLLLPPAPQRTRLRHLLLLLLLALGLLAGVSVSQSRQAEALVAHTDTVVRPAVKQVHLLSARVDALRGMAALHLAMRDANDRSQLDERLQGARVQLDRMLAGFGQRLVDDTDRQHHRAVAASLAVFWAAQDRLLAASRRAHAEPAAAEQARQLLAGEAQQAFVQLRAAIDDWIDATEQVAARSAQAALQLQAALAWAQVALAAAALALAVRLHWRVRRPPLPLTTASIDNTAARAHLQALNDAVATARRGEPGRASGLSALEAQRLAEQVAAAAQGLHRLIDRPTAAPQRTTTQPGLHGD